MNLTSCRTQNWWQKGLQSNMREVTSAQELVASLKNAGDKLVVVYFFSPGCGGCKALHPKINKFRDALSKHGPDRCSLGPTKGSDNEELMALSANRDLGLKHTPLPVEPAHVPAKDERFEEASQSPCFEPLPCNERANLVKGL